MSHAIKTPKNHYKKWDLESINTLKMQVLMNEPIKSIAVNMSRTEKSITFAVKKFIILDSYIHGKNVDQLLNEYKDTIITRRLVDLSVKKYDRDLVSKSLDARINSLKANTDAINELNSKFNVVIRLLNKVLEEKQH